MVGDRVVRPETRAPWLMSIYELDYGSPRCTHKALSSGKGQHPNCKLEDKTEDGEAIDCKKRPEDGEELEDEAVHSCDSCLQVFESLSDITEHKIHQCQLTAVPSGEIDRLQ
ncbi:hypothetical protein A6R68_21468, partial [Neotoma lepida]